MPEISTVLPFPHEEQAITPDVDKQAVPKNLNDIMSIPQIIYNHIHYQMQTDILFKKVNELINVNSVRNNRKINMMEIINTANADIIASLVKVLEIPNIEELRNSRWAPDYNQQLEVYHITFRQILLCVMIERLFNK